MQANLINAVLRLTTHFVPGAKADSPFTRSSRITFYEWTAIGRFSAGPLKFDFILSTPDAVLQGIERAPTDGERADALAKITLLVANRSAKSLGHAAAPVIPLRIVKGPDVELAWLTPSRRICMPWTTPNGPFLIEVGLG